jgi:PAS domain S-box-containing protein
VLASTNPHRVRILHLEDVRDETDLVENIVRKGGFSYEWKWASSKEQYLEALQSFHPDIVLSDHSMPGFSSVEAFRILRDLRMDIPFILLTATVSEDFAVMMMKEGVADYVLKDRPQRLALAIENSLEKWQAERQNRSYINQIIKSQANLVALMDNSGVNIFSLDRSFRYVAFNGHLNETVRKIYGNDIKIGDDPLAMMEMEDPAQAMEWREIFTTVIQGESLRFTKELSSFGGKLFFSYNINPIVEGDMITGLVCFALDTTKEKLTEANLAKSEARFRALTENNFDSILLSDENWLTTYASPSLARTLGYQPEELEAKQNVIRFHPDDWPALKEVYQNALARPGVPLWATARVRHKGGHFIWAEGVVTNMLENENVRGIVANYRDVTERKEAELQQAQMTRDLVQRNKDLEQFAYIVSHNLRGPVANILGISNILKHNAANGEDLSTAVDGLFTATSKLDEVIMDLNRILEVKQEINNRKETVVFQDIVDSISISIAGVIQKNNVNIVTDFSQVSGILTIRSFIQSIFYNLISNSIKYKQPNVDLVISISSNQMSNGIKLVFADNGMGIDLKSQGSRVFGLYRRFHTKHAEGKGMGLFMVKTQVESLGGEIKIKSEVNKGTEFTIEL